MKELVEKIRLAWKMFVAMALVVLRQRVLRRKLMFGVSLVAMLMTFAGMTFLDGFLTEHLLLMLAYWFICGGFVILMLLLALYDMMMLKTDQTIQEVEQMARILKEAEKMRAEEKKE